MLTEAAQDGQNGPVSPSEVLSVRMAADLRSGIHACASKRHMSVSTWVRNAIFTVMMLENHGTSLEFEADDIEEPA